MNIRILCVGKIKEKFYTQAVCEYAKRLSRYAKLDIIEVPDEKTPENASDHETELILLKEGQKLLKKIGDHDHCIAMAINGTAYDSEEFSEHLDSLMLNGAGTIDFIIGGSLGLSPEVLKRADETVSFSRLTFPHQLMRVILLEQIYRAFRIMKHEPYHK